MPILHEHNQHYIAINDSNVNHYNRIFSNLSNYIIVANIR